MKKIIYFLLSISLCSSLISCYRMPNEDEYSLIPTTNNPDVTREKGNQAPSFANY